jgi:hypothetical protein
MARGGGGGGVGGGGEGVCLCMGVRGRPGVVGRAHDFEGASPLGGDARIFEIASPESRKVGEGEDPIFQRRRLDRFIITFYFIIGTVWNRQMGAWMTKTSPTWDLGCVRVTRPWGLGTLPVESHSHSPSDCSRPVPFDGGY